MLLAALEVLSKARKPWETRHLPFIWPEEPKLADWHPPEMSPLIKTFLKDIKEARKREAEAPQ